MQRIAARQRPGAIFSSKSLSWAPRQSRWKLVLRRNSSGGGNGSGSSNAGGEQHGLQLGFSEQERVVDVAALLSQMRGEAADLVFSDFDDDEPVWEHEQRFKGRPMTFEEMQTEPPQLFQPDPLQAVADVVSAYSAEQGFREMSVLELSVALTAGGLIDLLLDVRSREEVEAGPTIPVAVNIPLDELSDAVRAGRLDQHITGSNIAVICASGQRSAQATVRLSKVFGFERVSNVKGGMAAWVEMQQGMQQGGGGCGCGGGGCH